MKIFVFNSGAYSRSLAQDLLRCMVPYKAQERSTPPPPPPPARLPETRCLVVPQSKEILRLILGGVSTQGLSVAVREVCKIIPTHQMGPLTLS